MKGLSSDAKRLLSKAVSDEVSNELEEIMKAACTFAKAESTNSLRSIRLGTKYEVADARKVASDVLASANGYSGSMEGCKQVIAMCILHLLYVWCGEHGYRYSGYAYVLEEFPDLEDVMSFLQGGIVEEEICDDGDCVKKITKFCSASEVIKSLSCYQHFHGTNNVLVYPVADFEYASYEGRKIMWDNLKKIYPYYKDVTECPDFLVHPWIAKTVMSLLSLDKKTVSKILFDSSVILQGYLDNRVIWNAREENDNPFAFF